MGVIGGAGVVFYGIHFVLTYFAFQVVLTFFIII